MHILHLLPFRTVITELHGIVPEELEFEGHKRAAQMMGVVESLTLRRSRIIIPVTDVMAKHLRSKYRRYSFKSYLIPPFEASPQLARQEKNGKHSLTVIYAGGAHKWQGVDHMVDAIKNTKADWNYVILTSAPDIFREMLGDELLDSGKILLASVPKCEIFDYYARADLGFVLREDNIVNRVACPVKLVEYLSCGVVPIVLSAHVGDFADYGYSYITLEDFLSGNIPSMDEIDTMRKNNNRIIDKMNAAAAETINDLLAECKQ